MTSLAQNCRSEATCHFQENVPAPKVYKVLPLAAESLQFFSNTGQVQNDTLWGSAELAQRKELDAKAESKFSLRTSCLLWAGVGVTESPGRGRVRGAAQPGGHRGELGPAASQRRLLQETRSRFRGGSCQEGGRERGCPRLPGDPASQARGSCGTGPGLRPPAARARLSRVRAPRGGRPDADEERAGGGRSAGTLQLWTTDVPAAHPSLQTDAVPFLVPFLSGL